MMKPGVHLEAGKPAQRNHVLIGILAALLLLNLTLPCHAGPARQGVIHKVYITDVRDTSFVVSWITDTASDGAVDWGNSVPLTNTATDPAGAATVHYMTLTGLTPSTTYVLQVRSGDLTDDNGGSYYSVTTGPTLGIPLAGQTVYGYVYELNGSSPVGNAVVYLQLQDHDGAGSPGYAGLVTARTDANGLWFYSALGNVRTADAGAYFSFTEGTDDLRIIAQGGEKGCKGDRAAPWIVPVPTVYPAQYDASLNGSPNAVHLAGFAAEPIQVGIGFGAIAVALLAVSALWYRREVGYTRRADPMSH